MAAAPGRNAMQMEEAMALADSYQAQLETLDHERQRLMSIESECDVTRRALASLATTGAQPIMVPVGAGTFVRARLEPVERVITPIGAGVHVGLEVEAAREVVKGRGEDAKKARAQIESTMGQIQGQLQDIMGAIQAAQQGAARPGPEGDA